jgi:hypothetical protein
MLDLQPKNCDYDSIASWGERVIPGLLRLAESGSYAQRVNALTLLERFNTDDIVPVLFRILQRKRMWDDAYGSPPMDVLYKAIRALHHHSDDPSVTEKLWNIIVGVAEFDLVGGDDKRIYGVLAILDLWEERGTPRCDSLATMLGHNEYRTRRLASAILCRMLPRVFFIYDKELVKGPVVPALMVEAENTDPADLFMTSRLLAIAALGKSTDQRALAFLDRLKHSQDARIASKAEEACQDFVETAKWLTECQAAQQARKEEEAAKQRAQEIAEVAKQRAKEIEAETARVREERIRRGVCTNCGHVLGFVAKLSKATSHAKCKTFVPDDKLAQLLRAPEDPSLLKPR